MQGLDREKFAAPAAAYRPAPLWVWIDDMTRENVQRQLQELKEHGFGGAFVHPRPGLVTEYLSDEWFARWNDALQEAIKLDLKLYIYDENSYPSGFAGGHVPSQFPDCLAQSVIFRKLNIDSLANLSSEASPMLNRPGHPIRAYAYEEATGKSRKIQLTHDLTDLAPSDWSQSRLILPGTTLNGYRLYRNPLSIGKFPWFFVPAQSQRVFKCHWAYALTSWSFQSKAWTELGCHPSMGCKQ